MNKLLSLLLILILSAHVFASDNSKYVNLFIGTAGDNGQVDPGAAVPYGMVRACPDSDPRSHSGYDFDITRISGFSINRLSGVGCSGAGGNISIKPSRSTDSLFIDKSSELAVPGYYTTILSNGVKAELTATHNVVLERFTYSAESDKNISVDLRSSFTKLLAMDYQIISPTEIVGYIQAANTCDKGAYKLYFSLTANQDCSLLSEENGVLDLSFGGTADRPFEVRIAISPISIETARAENQNIAAYSFEQIKEQAKSAWQKKLSVIDVEGSEDNKTLFYTSLYRTFLSPANVTSLNRDYLGTDGNVYKATDFSYYSSWSIWDTCRTKFPLLTLIDANAMSDFCNSLCKLYMHGKQDWSTDHESTPSVRTEHTVILLLDAYMKGIKPTYINEAYEGLKNEMNTLRMKSPDQKIEACNDLWAMANLAKLLGHEEDSKHYSQLSQTLFTETWNKEFKIIDSTFSQMKNNGLYQGTRWQYRWASPQYLNKMIEEVGGESILAEQLDTFFKNSMYNQGNEPDIQVPFLYNKLGHPVKSQVLVKQIINDDMIHIYGGNAAYPVPYYGKAFKLSPEGYMPEMDEDDGTMSAWYIFASIGLYPLVVGEPVYEIVSPNFDSITLHLDNGKDFVIKAINKKNDNDSIIKSVFVNGEKVNDMSVSHHEIRKGGELILSY